MVLDIRLSWFKLIVFAATLGSGISQKLKNGGCSSEACQGKTCIVLQSGVSYCNNCTNNKIGSNCNVGNPCLRNGWCSSNEECQVYINATGIVSTTCLTKTCDPSPCQGKGHCYIDADDFAYCLCDVGWKGLYCQEPEDMCQKGLCLNSATCRRGVQAGDFHCLCMYGFEGSRCENNIDDCANNPCMNNGTCNDLVASYSCDCPPDKTGLRCQDDNPCKSNPCDPKSECMFDAIKGYSCSCKVGWTGEKCDKDINECETATSGICEQGGYCINTLGSYYCNCSKGTEGLRCEKNIYHCSPNPCQNEGTCLSEQETFKCLCMIGFSGDRCEDKTVCDIDCNGGECIDDGNLFRCICPSNTTGQFCEYDLHGTCLTKSCLTRSCTMAEAKLCQNSGNCIKSVNGSTCECQPGFQGQYCQIDLCVQSPCQNNGACQRTVNGRNCICSDQFYGDSCELSVNPCSGKPCFNNGRCQRIDSGQNYSCTCSPGFTGRNCEKIISICDSNPCGSGGTCQEDSGKFKCICKAGMAGQYCDQAYCAFNKCPEKEQNGKCDRECNVTFCNYDGGDCANWNNPYKDCSVPECPQLFKNGRCDSMCNSESCLYDGFDCNITPVVCPNVSYCGPRFQNGHCDKECFNAPCHYDGTDCTSNSENVQGMIILQLLTTKEIFIENMEQFLYNLSTQLTCTVKVAANSDGSPIVNVVDIPKYGKGIEVYLKLVYVPPAAPCFTSISKALNFFSKEAENGTINGFPVTAVKSVSDPPEVSSPPTFIIIAVVFSVALIFVVVGIGYWKKKRVTLRTWLPPGFRRNRSSTDQMSSGSEKNIVDTCDSFSENSFNTDTFPKSSKGDFSDCSSTVAVPSFPANQIGKGSQCMRNIIDNRFNYPQNAMRPRLNRPFPDDIYTRLINEATRFYKETGETPLHLAARYSRADAAQKFLEDGADPNAQDNNGKTPLHAAIGADAVGVFQILLRCRTGSVNVQMKDGTTPLIYAVRLAIDGMVGDLIKADADLNKTDDQGKTGLHWAAAVNNLDAAILLLHHGGLNRDAQDDKGQTPLFLAAKEGSFNVAQLLLHNSASMDLADQLDRFPRDIAIEKRHFDIVKLLDDYSSHANQSRAYSNYSDHLLTTENGRPQKHKKTTASHEPEGGGRNRKKRKIDINETGSQHVSSSQSGMCGLNYQQHPRGYENSPYLVNGMNNPKVQAYHELQQWNKQNANNFMMNDPIKAKHPKGLQKKNNIEKHLIGSTGSSPSDSDFTVSPKEGSNGSPGYCSNGIVFVSSSDSDHYHRQMFGNEGMVRPLPVEVIQKRYPPGMKHPQHLPTYYGQYDEPYQDQAQFSKSNNVSSSSYYNIPSQQIIFQQYPTPPSQQFSPSNALAPVGANCPTATQRENLFETPSPGSGDQFVEASMTCDAPIIRQHNDMTAVHEDSSVC